MFNILIPFIVAGLNRLGGWGKYKFLGFVNAKYWRWLGIGIFLALMKWNIWLILTYYIATNIPYGDNSWIKKFMGRDENWVLYGACFGFASYPAIGLWALLQGAIGAWAFWFLMKWSNDGYRGWKLNHLWVEVGIGFLGSLLYWFI